MLSQVKLSPAILLSRLAARSHSSFLKKKLVCTEMGAMLPIDCFPNVKDEADAAIAARTRQGLTHFEDLHQCYTQLLGQVQVDAAQLEVCARAWKAAADQLPSRWLADEGLDAAKRDAAFSVLDRIIDWIINRPGSANEPRFATQFSAERQKLQDDEKYLSKVLGPYGQFKIPEARSTFEYALQRAQALDDYVIRLSRDLQLAEDEILGGAADECSVLKAKHCAQRSEQDLHSLDPSIRDVSSLISRDLAELSKALSQFRTLEWCINGLATQLDHLTNGVESNWVKIQKIGIEAGVLRPWKNHGSSDAVFDNFTNVFKEMDAQLLARLGRMCILSTSFAFQPISKRRGSSASLSSVRSFASAVSFLP